MKRQFTLYAIIILALGVMLQSTLPSSTLIAHEKRAVQSNQTTSQNMAGSSAFTQSSSAEQVGVEAAQDTFELPSPTGNEVLMGSQCQQSEDNHSFPSCEVRLSRRPGKDLRWRMQNIIYAIWSSDGSAFVLEDATHNLFVGHLNDQPRAVGNGFYVTPNLSPSGGQLAAVKLGGGVHILDQIANSPGIVLLDLSTGAERVIASDDVYAPFFIDEKRLVFGSGKNNHLASLYLIDLESGNTKQLTNRSSERNAPEPFPVAPPTVSEDGQELIFRSEVDGETQVHRLTIPDLNDTPTTGSKAVGAAPRSDNQNGSPSAARLETEGNRPEATLVKTLFQRPLATYQGVYQYFDHGNVRDWGCGNKTYAGHEGTDFTANVGSPVYAGAAGTLYQRYDGCPDSGYIGSTCGGGFGNHARIEHADGRVSIYAHLKSGTVIQTASVACGQYIGSTASSGSSNAPHLHFEIWNNRSGSFSIDPYYGTCDTSDTTDWIGQNGYPNGDVARACPSSWEFNTTGNFEGWNAFNISAASVNSGILFIDPAGSDPYIVGPDVADSAGSYPYVQFRMASNAEDGYGNVYFRTQAENYYSDDKRVEFSVSYCSPSTCNGGAPFYNYSIYMRGNPKWSGVITGIRIDPANNGRSGTSIDTIGIEYVRISPTP